MELRKLLYKFTSYQYFKKNVTVYNLLFGIGVEIKFSLKLKDVLFAKVLLHGEYYSKINELHE